jgi:hypothetical protein
VRKGRATPGQVTFTADYELVMTGMSGMDCSPILTAFLCLVGHQDEGDDNAVP